MSHARKQIRDAVAIAVTGLALTGGNVFKTRIRPLEEESLPALLIYTMNEASDLLTMGPNGRVGRELRVAIEVALKQLSNVDDTLDEIAAQVEVAIATNSSLKTLTKIIKVTSTTIGKSGEGDQVALGMILEFTAEYHTSRLDPETII
jgi:hypothetical protein